MRFISLTAWHNGDPILFRAEFIATIFRGDRGGRPCTFITMQGERSVDGVAVTQTPEEILELIRRVEEPR